jgi:hypothetical protein
MPSISRSRMWNTGCEADMGSLPMPMMGYGEAVSVGRGPPHERPDGTISPTARGSMRLRAGGPRRNQDSVRRQVFGGEIKDATLFGRSVTAAPLPAKNAFAVTARAADKTLPTGLLAASASSLMWLHSLTDPLEDGGYLLG